jgi:hypothetical protein
MIYKGYKISKSVERIGLYEVSDSAGNVLALVSLVIEAKKFIKSYERGIK